MQPPSARYLLSIANAICEADEVVVRAIFKSEAVSSDPLKLKDNNPSLQCFLPRRNATKDGYVGGLSVIHEDSRDHQIITQLARSTNTNVALKMLAKVRIGLLSRLNEQKLAAINIVRDDNPFEGHSEIEPMPSDPDDAYKIANQLRRVFREQGEAILPYSDSL